MRGRRSSALWVLLSAACLCAAAPSRAHAGDVNATGSPDGQDEAALQYGSVATVVLAPNFSIQHRRPEFGRDMNAAGASRQLVLGSAVDWAYDQLVENDDTEAYSFSYDRWNLRSSPTMSYPPLDHAVNVAGRRAFLTYVDFLSALPPNAQIVSAALNVTVVDADVTAGFSRVDSVSTVLMSQPGDSVWHQHRGLVSGLNHYSYANWNYQVLGTDQGGIAGRGHPAVSQGAWNPPLDSRVEFWEYGDWFDWCSTPRTIGVDSLFSIDITDCVQGIVNGAANNGLLTYIMNSDGNASWDFGVGLWEGTSASTRAPWITIKYVTRPYVSPFPDGAEWAFVFSTDDQVAHANHIYSDLFAERDMAYTIYTRADAVGFARYATWGDLLAWHAQGMEIGSHSRYHWGTRPDGTPFVQPNASKAWYGLNTYFSKWGDVGTFSPGAGFAQCTTGFDSLLVDSDPSWLYDGAYAAIQDSLRSDPYWGKSLATPGNVYRAEVIKATQVHGYRAVRTGQSSAMTLADGNRPSGFRAIYFRGAATDTIWSGLVGHHQRQPRNLVWQATNYASYDFVGPKADTAFAGHIDSVKVNFRRAVKIARAQNVNVINLFTHSLKSDRSYQYGINPDEMAAILDVVEEEGGWAARSSEYGRWLQQWATPVPTPSAYAQNDSFCFSASDRVWYQLDGVDRRFIRGFSVGGASPVPDPEQQSATRIAGNYPNPFNPQTTVVYNVRRAGRVRLDVFDVRGRRVCRLVDDFVDVGEHEVEWTAIDDEGRSVASGVYFCVLDTAADHAVRKLVVVR